MGNSEQGLEWGEIHGIINGTAWFILGNLGIWTLQLKSYRYSIHTHMFCMCCSAFLFTIGPIIMIVVNGDAIIINYWFHNLLGFILYCSLPILLISGAVCKISKTEPQIAPQKVLRRTNFHRMFGRIYFVCTQIIALTGLYGTSYASNIVFGVIIFVDVCSFSLFVYLKYRKQKMTAISLNPKFKQSGLRQIKKLKDTRIYSQQYFIFANYFYDLTNILGVHPGGWAIIQAIRTREVDRFIYGVDPIEIYDTPKIQHSSNSINLAGTPIAVLKIPQSYQNLHQLNNVTISYISTHDVNMKIHTIYFNSMDLNPFIYKGYSDISQIGRYYSLTVNQHKTRLYTVVNFLQPHNINLIMKISNNQIKFNRKFVKLKKAEETNQIEMIMEELKTNQVTEHQYLIPLMMKYYEQGEFTSILLQKNKNIVNKIVLSEQRGFGLALDNLNSKNIVIFAGGTGLYPYSDLIDLLYKLKIAQQKPQFESSILEHDPILKSKQFQHFTFKFYIAANQISQLHPITLYQCNYLCLDQNKFKCYVKVKKQNAEIFKKEYPNLNCFEGKFQNVIQKQVTKQSQTIFYICGPIRMTRSLVNEMTKLSIVPENYKIV